MSKNVIYENLNISNRKYKKKFLKQLSKFIDKGKFILGDNLKTFEKKFSKYIGCKYTIGVGNGLDALTMSLKFLNTLKKNKNEVILASNSYYACILSVINAGLKPVLVDPCLKTYNIDVNVLKSKINSNTLCILAVHMYGKTCEMDKLKVICKSKNLYLIEDCSQSHGAKFKNKMTGSFGDISCFSFYPTKNLGALGDAGAICCNNKKFYEILSCYRNYGSIKRYQNKYVGFNSRMDDLQALFLNTKLKDLDKNNRFKNKLAKLYMKKLSNKFIKPINENNKYDVFYTYCIRTNLRKKLINHLKKNNIGFDIHYPVAPYKQKALKKINFGKFPKSDLIHKTIISLPISTMHTKNDINHTIKVLNKFIL